MHTFESNSTEYILDVAWSPSHPALFASVDGSGHLDFWDLNKSTEMAAVSIEIDNRRALNKLKWSPRRGTEIIIGDDLGDIHIYELRDEFVNPNQDEDQRLIDTLNLIKRLNQEKIILSGD